MVMITLLGNMGLVLQPISIQQFKSEMGSITRVLTKCDFTMGKIIYTQFNKVHYFVIQIIYKLINIFINRVYIFIECVYLLRGLVII
jgi:hypothetical protein